MAQTDISKDLVLPHGRQVYILNDKGVIDTWVGPARVTSSGSNDTAVTWNPDMKRFDPSMGEPMSAVRPLVQASKGEYIILTGLPIMKSGDQEHPPAGTNTRGPEIDVSQRDVLHGPQVFALWPRQVANVIPGHYIALDQFIMVRVYDDVRAKGSPDPALVREGGITPEALAMGSLFVIKGTDISFYMPGPGVEVVKDESGKYVRDAVTLEQLEYAYLRDQSGDKEYVPGPAVVYPRPTQTFVTRTDDKGETVKKFRVIELTETSGIYIKVTAEYTEAAGPDGGKVRKAGDELFLVGRDYPLYWPRVEHMLITQNGSQIHYSIAIPDEGSAYYVRNKKNWIETTDEGEVQHKDGVVETIRGPKTLLIDPRNQTLVRRTYPLHLATVTYPGNTEVYEVNKRRLEEGAAAAGSIVYAQSANMLGLETKTAGRIMRSAVSGGFEGDIANRPSTYTKPHAIDLGTTKYEGAIRIAVRHGYVVLLTNSIGKRRIIKGGEVGLLDYDEYPVVLSFSTGTPKSGKDRRKDIYLRTSTKISDEVALETSDGVRLKLKLSYRTRFEGEPTKWFDVEDPTGFMTDNLRSIIHHAVSKLGIREFYSDAATKIRDTVLGLSVDGARAGRTFEENGLHVYDVDILGLTFEDRGIEGLFTEAAKDSFRDELRVAREQHSLTVTEALTTISVAKAQLAAKSAVLLGEAALARAQAEAESTINIILANVKKDEEDFKAQLLRMKGTTEVNKAERENDQAGMELELWGTARANEERIRVMSAETEMAVRRMAAIQPGLVDALTRLADAELIEKVTANLNVQSILGGSSVSDTLNKALAGTRLAHMLEQGAGKVAENGAKHPRS